MSYINVYKYIFSHKQCMNLTTSFFPGGGASKFKQQYGEPFLQLQTWNQTQNIRPISFKRNKIN